MWRNLQRHEVIFSGSEVNWLIDELCGERLPAINLAHVDLARGEQCPEQHGGGFSGRQHGLRLYPSFELLVQSFDRIGSPRAPPLARRQSSEGEEPVAGFLQAVGDGAVLEPPFADEGLAAHLDLLTGRRIDHVVVIRGDLVMQALWRVREKVPVLVHVMPTSA